MKRAFKSIYNQPYTFRNVVEWIQSGSGYFDRLELLINSSKHEIHLQTYIFDSDQTGNRIGSCGQRSGEIPEFDKEVSDSS